MPDRLGTAAAVCKKKGIQALDNILDAAHIYDGLSSVEQHLNNAVTAMEQRLKRLTGWRMSCMK